jgi:hypothetical protein
MVNPIEFKEHIKKIVLQDYQIEFLGKNFDQIVNHLNDTKKEKIYNWIKEVIENNIQPILVGTKKSYKEWTVNQLLTFRYPFSIGNTEYRIMFVKVKNSIYIEFHLGNHKYYDKVRTDLFLKESSYELNKDENKGQ